MSSSVSSKSKMLEVLPHPRRGDRLREDDVAALDVPAQHDLRRVLPTRSAIATMTGSSSTLPCAIGDQASVAMPCSASKARTASWVRYGCTSIWLTAGGTSVSSAAAAAGAAAWKFDTPIERARPSRLNSSIVRQVATKSPSYRVGSGQWIRNRST